MARTGNQLRAARALIDMDRQTLAARSGVDPAAIEAMEAHGAAQLRSDEDATAAVMRALEHAGVDFLDQGRPGVQLSGAPEEGTRPFELDATNDD